MIAFSTITDMRPAPGTVPTPAHYDGHVRLVQVAEELGYRTAWVSEQHGMDDGYLPSPLLALSAFARETTTIRLGTGIVILPFTQLRRLAQDAGVLDVLSGGRLTLGVGSGVHPHEFRIYERRLEDRGPAMEEGLAFLRTAFATGRAPQPDGLPLPVPPVQRPLPLIVGGLVRPALDRAARLADGHFGFGFYDPEEDLTRLYGNVIAPAMERHGRDASDFQLIASTMVWASEDWEREWRDHVGPAFQYQQRRYAEWAGGDDADLPAFVTASSWDLEEVRARLMVGPPAEVAERLSAIHAGYPFDEFVVWPTLPGVPHELAEQFVRTFATEVAPAIGTSTGTAKG